MWLALTLAVMNISRDLNYSSTNWTCHYKVIMASWQPMSKPTTWQFNVMLSKVLPQKDCSTTHFTYFVFQCPIVLMLLCHTLVLQS